MELQDISLVIFDCDGTLVDTESLTARLMTSMMIDMGIEISLEECTARFIGTKFSDVAEFVAQNGFKIDPIKFEYDYRMKCKDIFEKDLQPIPGVIDLLEKLHTDYCIASNGPKEKMEVTLETSGLLPYFKPEQIYSAYDIKKWKPKPDLFLTAAEKMNHKPSQCLVIEDTIHGVRAAITAEMKVIGINVKHNEKEIEELGVVTYTNIEDLSSAFEAGGLFG